ncbi:MAG: hypothetical protein HYZ00_11870, partial [Candidatus Hydrogenedentes bacterium]|nr:hypothetical protein [Candidatus Hydrogenedentota bacterium]
INITSPGDNVVALSLREDHIPPGWAYNGEELGSVPGIRPKLGSTGALDFSFGLSAPKTFPVTFSYTLAVPPNTTGAQEIEGHAGLRERSATTDGEIGPEEITPQVFTTVPFGGALVVELEPQGIKSLGQWQLDSGPWQNSSAELVGLLPGTHTLSFKAVPGWQAPDSRPVEIVSGQSSTETGVYTPFLRLSVSSTGLFGVQIASDTGQGGTTPYTVYVPPDSIVTLTAPEAAGGACFDGWSGDLTESDRNISFVLNSDASLTADYGPCLRLSTPNGGESWGVGTTHMIGWTAKPATGPTVILKLRRGSTTQYLKSTSNTGSWNWTLPTDLTPADDYTLLIVTPDYLYRDFSDGPFRITAAPLRLTKPNGGESWDLGTSHLVTWTARPETGSSIILKLRRGSSTQFLASTPNTGSWNWNVSTNLTPATDYKLLIVTPDYLYSDLSDGTFTLTRAPLQLTKPNGGELWTLGSLRTITWTALPETGAEVKFKLIKPGQPDVFMGPLPNTGSWIWDVSLNLPEGADYTLRIYTPTLPYLDDSNGPFSLVHAPLTLTSPNGGEVWTMGGTKPIMWVGTTVGNSTFPTVKIRLFKGGQSIGVLSGLSPNTGRWDWLIRDDYEPDTDYSVQVYTPNPFNTDLSNRYFTLVAPPLRLTSPNGGETWSRGSTQTVTWQTTLPAASIVKFKLYRNGVFQNVFPGSGTTQTNDGTMTWTLNLPASVVSGGGYRILIYTTDGVYQDRSNGTFTISNP